MEAEAKTAVIPGKPEQILRKLAEEHAKDFLERRSADEHKHNFQRISAQIFVAELMEVVPANVCAELKAMVTVAYRMSPTTGGDRNG